MAFNTNSPKQSFTASNGQVNFDFNFKIFNTTDLVVYKTAQGQTPDDVNDLLTITTDYTVAINGDSGGTMTLTSGATLNDTIIVKRKLPLNRNYDYQTGGDFLANTIDEDQDYQTYLSADTQKEVESAIRLPDSAVGIETKLPDVVGDAYLKWNSSGDALENDTTLPTAVVSAEDSNLEAQSWANENEDVPVKEYTSGVPSDRPGPVFSAKHHALKAEASAIRAEAFDPDAYRLPTPTLTGNNTVNENSTLLVTITNYDATASYEVLSETTCTVAPITSATITVTASTVGSDTAGSFEIRANKDGYLLGGTVTYNFTVLNVPIQDDNDYAISVADADFNSTNFPTVEGGYLDDGIVATLKGGDGASNPSTTNLVPIMTSNAQDGYILTSSSELDPYLAYRMFDGSTASTNDAWNSAVGVTSATIEIETPTAEVVNKISIFGHTALTYNIKDWTFEGWDGSSWEVLDTVTDAVLSGSVYTDFTFTNSRAYSKYRLNITAGNGANQLAIIELKLIEAQVALSQAVATSAIVTKSDGEGDWVGTQAGGTVESELVDILTEGLLGDELITNGTFDTDYTGWLNNVGGTPSVSNGEFTFVRAQDGNSRQYQLVPVEIGKTYKVKLEIVGGTAPEIRIANSLLGTGYVPNILTTGTYEYIITSETNTISIEISAQSGGATAIVDNISVKQLNVKANSTDILVQGQVTDGDKLYVGTASEFNEITASGVVDNLDGTWTLPHNQAFTPTFALEKDNVSIELSADNGVTYDVIPKLSGSFIADNGATIKVQETLDALTLTNSGQQLGFKVKQKVAGTKTNNIQIGLTEQP